MMTKYLETTPILDFEHSKIQKLANDRGWKNLSEKEKVKQVYTFVRDEIRFGYNLQWFLIGLEVKKKFHTLFQTERKLTWQFVLLEAQ